MTSSKALLLATLLFTQDANAESEPAAAEQTVIVEQAVLPAATPVATPAPTPIPVAVPQPTPAPLLPQTDDVEREWKTVFGIFATSMQFASFSEGVAITNSGPVDFTAEGDFDGAYGISLSARKMPKNSLGLEMGLSQQFNAKFKSFTITVGNSGDTSDVYGIGFKVLSAYVNAIYRWNGIYLPIGINLSSPEFTGDSDGAEIYGGVGAQIGIGFQSDENIGFEILSQATRVDLRISDSTSDVDFGDGFVSSVRFQLKVAY